MKRAGILMAFMAVMLIGHTQAHATTKKFKVGFIIPETRQDQSTPNPWGIEQRRGFELALKQKNNIELVFKDNSESALVAVQRAKELSKEGVDMIAGLSFSDQAVAVKQFLDGVQMPFLTVLATSEKLFENPNPVFSMALSNDSQAERLVSFLTSLPAATKDGVALVVARNCEYCVNLEQEISTRLKKKNITVGNLPDILRNRPIPDDYFEKVKTTKVIGILAYEVEAISVLTSLKKQRFDGVVFGGDSWTIQSKQIESDPSIGNTVCLVSATAYDKNAAFPENLKLKSTFPIQNDGVPSDVAALSYDAGLVIGKLAVACKSPLDRKDCIRKTLPKIHLEGASGTIEFAPNGKRVGNGLLLKSPACKSANGGGHGKSAK